MGVTAKKIGRNFTFADYRGWTDEERWEIISGEAYAMTPAPSLKHQEIVSNLHIRLKTDPQNKCYTAISPTDVVLDDFNVVQPDVFVVCDKSKLKESHVQGAPDLIIEVLSKTTQLKDKREKKTLYERFGVQEYLIVNPEDEMVERYRLVNGQYLSADVFNWDETLKLVAMPDITINLWEIFARQRPQENEVI
ncbi:MAG: Uma2 family endonuclease [Syntrophales bacterium]